MDGLGSSGGDTAVADSSNSGAYERGPNSHSRKTRSRSHCAFGSSQILCGAFASSVARKLTGLLVVSGHVFRIAVLWPALSVPK